MAKQVESVTIYCPVCAKHIQAVNKSDVENGYSDSYVFVHDDVTHSDEDIDSLKYGVN